MSSHQASLLGLARRLPDALLCISVSGVVLEANRPAQQILGRSGHDFHLADVAHEEQQEVQSYLRICYRSRTFLPGIFHFRRADGSLEPFRIRGMRLKITANDAAMVLLRLEAKDEATAVFTALNLELQKLTTQRRRLNKQRNLIRKQKADLLEFSAPMIDVWDGILLVPLLGVPNESYFDRVLTNLLDAVARKHARWVILDMTGAPSTSSLATTNIARIARAVRLLGASCILAGLGPQVAQLIVAHGDIPQELSTEQNLHAALARCLREDHRARMRSGH